MKANTSEHMKFLVLRRLLNIPKYQIIGILEGLWTLTASSAQDGAIGKFSNIEIASWLEYEGNHDFLIDSLTESGFLDPCETNRLIIHDWEDHCPKYIKGNMSKHEKVFAKQVAKQAANETAKQGAIEARNDGATKSSQVKSSQSKSSQVNPSKHVSKENDDFNFVWVLYPKREGGNPKEKAKKAWTARINDGCCQTGMTVGLKAYRQYCEQKGIVGTSYVMQAATFFGPDRRWEEDWEPPQPMISNAERQRKDALNQVLGESKMSEKIIDGEVSYD